MGNAVEIEQAQQLIEKQREASKAVDEFFAPYIEVEKRVRTLCPYYSQKGLQQEFHLDTDPDNEQAGYFSFKTEEFEEYPGEFRTEWLTVSEELIGDPAAYEKRKIEEREAEKRRIAADELRVAKSRLEAAQKELKRAEKSVEEKSELAGE